MAVARDNYDPYALQGPPLNKTATPYQAPTVAAPKPSLAVNSYNQPGGAAANTAPPPAPGTQPAAVHPLAGWGSVQQGNFGNAFADWAQQNYGGSGGFANTGGDSLQQALDKFYNATGMRASVVPGGKGDKATFNGQTFDLVRGAGTANPQFWSNIYSNPNAPRTAGNPAGYAGGGAGAPGAGGAGAGAPGADQAMRDMLLQIMQRSNTPFDPNAAQNKGMQDAYNYQRERAAQQERAAMAERAAAEGLNSGGAGSGAFDTTVQGIKEQQGQDEAGYAGQLASKDYDQKRSELMNALQIANSVGARDQATALQSMIANMDNQYRYSALAQNQSQFNDNYGLQNRDFLARQNYLSLLYPGQ